MCGNAVFFCMARQPSKLTRTHRLKITPKSRAGLGVPKGAWHEGGSSGSGKLAQAPPAAAMPASEIIPITIWLQREQEGHFLEIQPQRLVELFIVSGASSSSDNFSTFASPWLILIIVQD